MNNSNLYANLYSIYFLSSNWNCVVVSHNTEHELKHVQLLLAIHPHRVFIRRPSCEAASGHRVKIVLVALKTVKSVPSRC